MLHNARTPFGTAWAVSVDAAKGTTTGISAHDRAHTIKTIIDPKTGNKIVVKTVKKGGQDTEVIVEQRLIYDQLHRAFHTLTPRKVMLLF